MNKDYCPECLLYGRRPDDCSKNPLACLDKMWHEEWVAVTENYLMYGRPTPLGWDEVSPFTMGR